MTPNARPKVSKKNKYFLEKHRFLELKHFALQYDDWVKKRDYIDEGNIPSSWKDISRCKASSPTEALAMLRIKYAEKIGSVHDALDNACESCKELRQYMFIAVTKETNYEQLASIYHMPMCRESFYKLYRRFYWELDKLR